MRRLLICLCLLPLAGLSAKRFTVSNAEQLYKAVANKARSIDIILKPGTYDLMPQAVTDSTLGNALKPDSMIAVTTGLHLVGKNYRLLGTDRRKTIIRTKAGYGIFIEHCPQVLLKDLTITDGIRDQDGNATSAAIVVKHSGTEITGCLIEHNQGDFSQTIAGIIGICGREGSRLFIHNNIIRHNSWDGIALYRKAKATITDNLIFAGRGAGIGITWNAEAYLTHNVIHHYWKGIGSFGTASAKLYANLVRDVRGWGIIASGQSRMECYYNEVRRAGNVGMACWDSTASLIAMRNVICQSGQEKQWVAPLVGIWNNGSDSLVCIRDNLFWGNKEANIAAGYKEPGSNCAAFTFDRVHSEEGNFLFLSTPTLNEQNYYTDSYAEPPVSSFRQSIPNPDVGIMGGIYKDYPWTWDPDKEPF